MIKQPVIRKVVRVALFGAASVAVSCRSAHINETVSDVSMLKRIHEQNWRLITPESFVRFWPAPVVEIERGRVELSERTVSEGVEHKNTAAACSDSVGLASVVGTWKFWFMPRDTRSGCTHSLNMVTLRAKAESREAADASIKRFVEALEAPAPLMPGSQQQRFVWQSPQGTTVHLDVGVSREDAQWLYALSLAHVHDE